MNFPRRSLVGLFLLSQLAILPVGCGGDSGPDAVSVTPDPNAPPPDPSKMMPGFNDMQENVKTKGANP